MITINNRTYIMPLNWSDLTLSVAERLYAIKPTKAIQDRFDIFSDSREPEKDLNEWVDTVQYSDIIPYIDKVIECLTEIDSLTLTKVPDSQKLYLYFHYLEKFAFGVRTLGLGVDIEPLDTFMIKSKFYFAPQSKAIMDMQIPLEGISMAQFTEATDLLNLIDKEEDGFKYMSYAIAVLCMEKGQEYNEDIVLINGKEFKELDMETVWGVFFCLMDSVNTYEADLLSCSESLTAKK